MITRINDHLARVKDPVTGMDLASLGVMAHSELADKKLSLSLTFGYPGVDKAAISEALWQQVSGDPEIENMDLDIGWVSPDNPKKSIEGVKHIIAVASGKGGVGKSTTAVNVALALSHLGAKVGILDADIYGPSQPHMLGIGQKRPEVIDGKHMLPIVAHGIESMSMGYLVTEKTPMVWRGPMASGALTQLLTQTQWGGLDYLIIDMPPGTGDIQLTLSQQVPVSGAVTVTTPQDIALLDAKKAIEMFTKVSVPTLGIIENMSVHICSNCGHQESIFGEGGGQAMATQYQVPFLGALPLNLSIRLQVDSGVPSVAADPASAISQHYLSIATALAGQLWQHSLSAQAAPTITITND